MWEFFCDMIYVGGQEEWEGRRSRRAGGVGGQEGRTSINS